MLLRKSLQTIRGEINFLRHTSTCFGFSSTSEGQRFQDIAFKFEEQWQTMIGENNEANLKELKNQMTENQRKRIDMIASALVELDFNELKYFELLMGERARKNDKDISLMSLYTDWPQVKRAKEDGKYIPVNPNWFLQQESLSKMWPGGIDEFAKIFNSLTAVLGGGSPMGVGGAAGGQAQAKTEEKATKAEGAPVEAPKVQEREFFDIEIAAIDAAQKIKIIKEIRGVVTIGLKEAKDLVEKLPCVLKKEVKKAEAEAIKEKLIAAGCTINLV